MNLSKIHSSSEALERIAHEVNAQLLIVEASSQKPGLPSAMPIHVSKAVARFTERFPKAMEILRKGGVHPYLPGELNYPLSEDPCEEEFGHIGEHCIATALAASKICTVLEGQGKLKSSDSHRIIERALIHDASKAYEILTRRAIRELARTKDSDIFQRSSKLNQSLRDFEKELRFCGKECGHNNLAQYLHVGYNGLRGVQKGMLPQKIIRIADEITATTSRTDTEPSQSFYLPVGARMAKADFRSKYPKLFRSGLGVKRGISGYQVTEVRNTQQAPSKVVLLGTYVELQVFVAVHIAFELQEMIDPTSSDSPMNFILRLVSEG